MWKARGSFAEGAFGSSMQVSTDVLICGGWRISQLFTLWKGLPPAAMVIFLSGYAEKYADKIDSKVEAYTMNQDREKSGLCKDITGQVFRRLTALYPTAQRYKGSVVWHCRCKCGNEVDVCYNMLKFSHVQSCGCQKKEQNRKLKEFRTVADGTALEVINSKKIPSNNTSGVRGVYWSKGKWHAKIVFQKKQFTLGAYEHLEDAANARKEAEEILFDRTAEHMEKWKRKASEDPRWAKDNPIKIYAEKRNGTMHISLLPQMEDHTLPALD